MTMVAESPAVSKKLLKTDILQVLVIPIRESTKQENTDGDTGGIYSETCSRVVLISKVWTTSSLGFAVIVCSGLRLSTRLD